MDDTTERNDEMQRIRANFRNYDPPHYVGDDLHGEKVRKTQDLMEEYDLDGLLMLRDEIIRYFTDFFIKGYGPWKDFQYLCVVPSGEEPVLGYASGSDRYRVQLQDIVEDTRRLPGFQDWDTVIEEIFTDYGIEGRVGTDILPFFLYDKLQEKFPNVEFVDANEFWEDLTVIKSDEEIEIIREGISLAEIGMKTAIEAVEPGIKEYEIAAEAEYAMRKEGSEFHPFIPDLCAGKNSGVFNRIPTENRVKNGDLVTMDMGAVYRGYNCEFARTVSAGTPSRDQREVYQVVHEAVQNCLETIGPGVQCQEVDRAAREVIRDAGYEEYEHDRLTGHQTAYALHGEPAIDEGVETELKPGMVVNFEPRIAMFDDPQVGSVQLEEVVLITDDGFERLTTTQYDESLLE